MNWKTSSCRNGRKNARGAGLKPHFFLGLFAMLATGCSTAAPVPPEAQLQDQAQYSLTALPADQELTLAPGSGITFLLEENATTGYVWSARSSSPAVTVKLKSLPPPSNGLCGAPGKVQVTLQVSPEAGEEPVEVRLTYARPWEKTTPPVYCIRLQIHPRAGSR